MNRILFIDDDPALTRAVAMRLRTAGFDVHICGSAQDASDVVGRYQPNLIILDLDMPRYAGYEFHQCMQFSDRAKHIPVIYLTGHDSEIHRRIAFELGARAFLTKPYEHEHMLRTIHGVLGIAEIANAI